ncbi:MAG: L-arabinose isomerase family protein [Candidatus Zipacnadales bacterium]
MSEWSSTQLGPEYDPLGRTRSGKVGVFSVGLDVYWPQFPGLKERLLAHAATFAARLREAGVTVVSGGMSDSSHRAFEIGSFFRREEVDLVICDVVTYAPASTAVIVAQRAAVPFVLVGLQPMPRMDYAQATTELQLENDNVTSLPEICGALLRCGITPADVICGRLHDDQRAWRRVLEWASLAPVLHDLRNARVGLMGHVYEGMLDMHSDPTMFTGAFGMHVEVLEMDDLAARVTQVTQDEIAAKIKQIRNMFAFPEPGADPLAGPVSPETLERSARVAVGLDRLVKDFGLTGLAYYYRGLNNNEYEQLAAAMIVGNSLLTGRGVPVAGELDLKNCVAMLIMDRLGAGGSFAELHPVDFVEDFVLVGHDGPAHIAISGAQPVLRGLSLYHGKRGSGASVEFFVRPGPITILGLTQTHDGRFKMVVAEGESLLGPIPATGNTNTRAKFPPDVATFIERWSLAGPTHHFALGIGHQAARLQKLANALHLEYVNVTEG